MNQSDEKRVGDALAKLKETDAVAHQEVLRDEEGVPIDSEHMLLAIAKARAEEKLSTLGRGFMFRAMEAMNEDFCTCCMVPPTDPVLTDLADAVEEMS